jgi:hypothetical protein
MGHAAEAAKAGDSFVLVAPMEFVSSEDGQRLIKVLEVFVDHVLRLLAAQCGVTVWRSQVDHLLAIVNRDRTATVYLNELPQRVGIQALRPIKPGEPVAKNDIADIERVDLGGVTVPSDSGMLFFFSVGWRRAVFYDFGPLNPNEEVRRTFDCPVVLAQLYARVLFQERFGILESEWESLFAAKLFPFVGLRNETIDAILSHLRFGWDLSVLSDAIVAETRQRLPCFLESWRRHPVFIPHISFLERAAERFGENDYLSCVGLLVPRVEGILRSHHVDIGRKDQPGQTNLADSAVASKIAVEGCLLLPERFKEYLTKVYFAAFDGTVLPCDSGIALSRHSVAHGVAPADAFSPLEAAIGFLVLHQLFWCFQPATVP